MAKLPYTTLLGLIGAIVLGLGGAFGLTGAASADIGLDVGGGVSIKIDDEDDEDVLGGLLSDEDEDGAPVIKKATDKVKQVLDSEDEGLINGLDDVTDTIEDGDDEDDDSVVDEIEDVIDDVTAIDDEDENSDDDNESSSLDDVIDDLTGIGDDDDEDGDDTLNQLLGDASPAGSLLGNDGQPLGGVLDEDESSSLDPILDDLTDLIDEDDRSATGDDLSLGGLAGDNSPLGDLVGDDGELLGGVLDDDDDQTQDDDDGAGLNVPDLSDVTDIINDDPDCQGVGCGPTPIDTIEEIVDLGWDDAAASGNEDDEASSLDGLVEELTGILDEDDEDTTGLGDLLGDGSPIGDLVGDDDELLGGVLDENEGSFLNPTLNDAADLLDEDDDTEGESLTLGNLTGDNSPIGDLVGDNGEPLGGVLDDETGAAPAPGDDSSSELLDELTGLLDFQDGPDELLAPLGGILDDDSPIDLCLEAAGVNAEAGDGCNQDTSDCTTIDANCLLDEALDPVIGPSSFTSELVRLCVGVPGVGAEGNTGSGCGDDSGEDDPNAGIDDIIDEIEDLVDDLELPDLTGDLPVIDDLPVGDLCIGGIGIDCDEDPDDGDGDPGDGTDGNPGDGTDGDPGDGTDGDPGDGTDGNPGDGTDGNPGDGDPDDGDDDGTDQDDADGEDDDSNNAAASSTNDSPFNTATGSPVIFNQTPLPPAAPIEAPVRQPAPAAPGQRFTPAQAGDGGLLGTPAVLEEQDSGTIEGFLALVATLLMLVVFIGLTRAQKR